MKSLVIVPTYNEAANIEDLISGIQSIAPEFEVLIVDDGSPDGTADLVEGKVHLMRGSEKRGLGPAYVTGMRWALERDYDFVFQMDADGSHRLSDLSTISNALLHADCVIGSRWITGGSTEKWPLTRRALSRTGSWYSSAMLGLGVKDATSGFRGYRVSILRALNLDRVESKGYAFQIEMTKKVSDLKAEIMEVPITFVERERGQSKMTLGIALEAFLRVTVWGLRRLPFIPSK